MASRGRSIFEILRISSPLTTVRCRIRGVTVEALYCPTIGANIISGNLSLDLLNDVPLAPTTKAFKCPSGPIIEGCGILQHVNVLTSDTEVILDLHVFDVLDFDLLIGVPIERLLDKTLSVGYLDVSLGKETFSVSLGQAKNAMADPFPEEDLAEEVMAAFPFESPEAILEHDAQQFVE